MTTTNLWLRLKNLLPEEPLLVGTVTLATSHGAKIELPDGSHIFVRGSASVGQRVFIRNGVIEGSAPNLPTVTIDI